MDTTELRHELPVYTISGTLDVGKFWVVAVEFIDDDTSAVSAGTHEVPGGWHMFTKPVTNDRAFYLKTYHHLTGWKFHLCYTYAIRRHTCTMECIIGANRTIGLTTYIL